MLVINLKTKSIQELKSFELNWEISDRFRKLKNWPAHVPEEYLDYYVKINDYVIYTSKEKCYVIFDTINTALQAGYSFCEITEEMCDGKRVDDESV